MPTGSQASQRPLEIADLLGLIDEERDAFSSAGSSGSFQALRIGDMVPVRELLVLLEPHLGRGSTPPRE
jgi:hypothetical protein